MSTNDELNCRPNRNPRPEQHSSIATAQKPALVLQGTRKNNASLKILLRQKWQHAAFRFTHSATPLVF